jgi:hypothetical protein
MQEICVDLAVTIFTPQFILSSQTSSSEEWFLPETRLDRDRFDLQIDLDERRPHALSIARTISQSADYDGVSLAVVLAHSGGHE